VFLTEGADRDLEEIYDHLAEVDSEASAQALLGQLLEIADTLAEFPERGACPKELQAVGLREYRQVIFKRYRVIYRVSGKRIFVYLIVDGRRDVQSLLERRLLSR
jgi:toxin ParE1/3/4